MAEVFINSKKILNNLKKINNFMKNHNMQWSLILKVLGGNEIILKKIISNKIIKDIHSVGDSHISSLKKIKELDTNLLTVYIRPPSINDVKDIVSYADISYNTTLKTLVYLNKEAKKQNKTHKVVLMIEMGELREGILGKNLVNFYSKVSTFSNIEIIGIGSNWGCMYGVEPTYDKLSQLLFYKQVLETKFNKKIDLISGGSSITLPLLGSDVDDFINHFRIGEAVFLGTSPLNNIRFNNLHTDCFEFRPSVIEVEEKSNIPDGIISDANVGHTASKKYSSSTSYKIILDFGALDVDNDSIVPKNSSLEFVGTTSDMTVYSLGNKKKYRVGDILKFKPNYMGVAKLMRSKFVNKIIV